MNRQERGDAVARLRELFVEAIELPPAQRREFLERLAHDDPASATKLAALIDVDARLTQTPTEPLLPQLRTLRLAGTSWAGRHLGAWIVGRELGAGGMGAVYLGEPADPRDGTRVAIKLMHADLLDTPARRRFLRERQMLATLSHPLIARYIAAGEHDGALYAVMEYVDGAPLLQYADRCRLDLRERVALFLKVCAAVGHAHSHRIVHRDIKSSNILVAADGRPKLIDFGIAKPLHRPATERTATAQRFFSPRSAAPEQITGDEVGVETDIYGLGALLYELLCGEPPLAFDGLTPGQIENAILHVVPIAPSLRAVEGQTYLDDARARLRGYRHRDELAAALHGELDDIVLMALRKKPAERYASIDLFAADLRNALRDRPTAAGRLRRFARWFDALRRRRAIVAAAAAATIAVTALWLARAPSRDDARMAAAPVADRATRADSVDDATTERIDAQGLLGRASALLHGDPASTVALADRVLVALDPAVAANAELRTLAFDAKAAALIRLADFVAARSAIDAGVAAAASQRQRALLRLRHVELLDALGRSDAALAALRDVNDYATPSLPSDDALAMRIRERLAAAAKAAAPTTDATMSAASEDCSALIGATGVAPTAETLQRHLACIARIDSGGDPAARLALRVAYGRLLNRAGNYDGAARVLDTALDDARSDPALRGGDTHRIATLAAALAHYGADANDANRERLRNELARSHWIAEDDGRAEWREQADVAGKLGVAPSTD